MQIPTWEVVASTTIIDNALLVTPGLSWFHMRPIVALELLLRDFEFVYNTTLSICVGDKTYAGKDRSIIWLTLAGLVKWKQFSLRATEWILSEDILQNLQEKIIRLDEIGESVPNAINKILAGL